MQGITFPNPSYLYFDTEQFSLGTPNAVERKGYVVDMEFGKFALNDSLLHTLDLPKISSINTATHLGVYLSAFLPSLDERIGSRKYLQSGKISIAVKDPALENCIKAILAK
jgi:hypothetical protein